MLYMLVFGWTIVNAQQISSYRNVIEYPYHAAPYYSYPYTSGYGYQYSTPIVNAEYSHTHNNQDIVTYPDGPYNYGNYYKYGVTTCYLKSHQLFCSY